MSAATALDLLVAGLLAATIVYAILLNRRLRQLRDGSAQMERMIADFYQATTRAEAGLTALKEIAGRPESEVMEQLQSLTKLRDELDYLVSRAEAQSGQLEELIRAGRAATPAGAPAVRGGQAPDSGLDAELFGDPAAMPGSGARPRRVAPAIQELR